VIALIVAMSVLLALLFFMWIAIGREPGPAAVDVAIAYERAWDELDFNLLYDLSGPGLRDGLRRDQFIAAKRAAYARPESRERLGADITVDTSVAGHQTALVVTRVVHDGSPVRNNVMLEHTANGWLVVGYSLRPDTAATGSVPPAPTA
jgi:hypothetical protein